jgi:hypothetical protein
MGAAKEATGEFVQEGANALAGNLGARAGGDPTHLMHGVAGSGMLGAIAGGPSGAGGAIAQRYYDDQQAEQEARDRSLGTAIEAFTAARRRSIDALNPGAPSTAEQTAEHIAAGAAEVDDLSQVNQSVSGMLDQIGMMEEEVLAQSEQNAATQEQMAAEQQAAAEQLARAQAEEAARFTSQAAPRETGESDDAYARRVVDKLPAPTAEHLPDEPDSYFERGEGDLMLDVGQLASTHKETSSDANAARRMAASREGALGKRGALEGRMRADGTVEILDGNGTLAAAQQLGWQQLPVRIVEAEQPVAWQSVDADVWGALTKVAPDFVRAEIEKANQPKGAPADPLTPLGTLTDEKATNRLTDEMRRAEKILPTFRRLAEGVAQGLGIKTKIAPLKGRARAEEKMQKKLAGDATYRLKDLVRMTFVVDSAAAGDALYRDLTESKRLGAPLMLKSGRVDGRNLWAEGSAPLDASGYRDAQFVVELDNGTYAEIQISTPAMLAEKDGAGHKFYEITRALEGKSFARAMADGVSPKDYVEGSRLTNEERALAERALSKSAELYGAAYEASRAQASSQSSQNSSGDTDIGPRPRGSESSPGTITRPSGGTTSSTGPSARNRSANEPSSQNVPAAANTSSRDSAIESSSAGTAPATSDSTTSQAQLDSAAAPDFATKLIEKMRALVPGVDFRIASEGDADIVALQERGDLDATTGAFYDPGAHEVVIVAERIEGERTLREELTHEVTHAGLRVLLGKGYEPTMRRVFELARDVPQSIAGVFLREGQIGAGYLGNQNVGADGTIDFDSLTDEQIVMLGDEIAAHMSERYADITNPRERGVLSKIAEAVRAVLRKVVPGKKYSDTDVYDLINASHRAARSKRRAKGADGIRQRKRADIAPVGDRLDVSKMEVGARGERRGTPLSRAFEVAGSRKFRRGRDLKQALQDESRAAQEESGINLREMTQASFEMLRDAVVEDALYALESNENAIGWYDKKVAQALAVIAIRHPEIVTDPAARTAFKWAIAVTSNGLKVDKNFQLAEQAYSHYRKHGEFPTDIGIGTASSAINEGLAEFNKISKRMPLETLEKFLSTEFTVSEIEGAIGIAPGGEWKTTTVRGAAILGPKIGNGFLSNLNGYFDALTMDRWLMRTWGRITGELIVIDQDMTANSRKQLGVALNSMDKADRARLAELIKASVPTGKLTDENVDALANAINKASQKPEVRDSLAALAGGDAVRKAGNNLAKALDGQKEAPSGPLERSWIRTVFGGALEELQKSRPGLTMVDLQALLWYPEKRLYDAAKSKDDATAEEAYADEDAPDYANAAVAMARRAGTPNAKIEKALRDAEKAGSQQARAFTAAEKREFLAKVKAPPEQQMAVVYEVAPNPDDATMVGLWSRLDDKQKRDLTNLLGKRVFAEVAELLGVKLPKAPVGAIGGYEGDTNPNLIGEYSKSAMTVEQAIAFASALGYVLDQKAMVLADARVDDTVEVIRITVDGAIGKRAEEIFAAIRKAEPSIDGFTARGSHMDVLNFSGRPTEEVARVIAEALPDDAGVSHAELNSKYISKESYDGNLQGARPADREGLGAGLDRVRDQARLTFRGFVAERAGGNDGAGASRRADGGASEGDGSGRIRQAKRRGSVAGRVGDAERGAEDGRRSGQRRSERSDGGSDPVRGAGVAPDVRGARQEAQQVGWNRKPVRPDAVRVSGRHFSDTAGLTALDGRKYGKNHKGAEYKRLLEDKAEKKFAPLWKRVYFYPTDATLADMGESVVGRAEVYEQTLSNIYDGAADALGLIGKATALSKDNWTRRENEFELLVLQRGYDGYRIDNMVVVLGATEVPVNKVDRVRSRKRTLNTTAFNAYTVPTESFTKALAETHGNAMRRYTEALKASGRKFRRVFQDDMYLLKDIEAHAAELGKYDENLMNVYQRAELYYGRVGNRIEMFKRDFVKPFLHALAKSDVTIDELQEYLYAKFAPVRNRKIWEMNQHKSNADEYVDGKSGMTNQDAKDILDAFKAEGKAPQLDALAQMVYAMNTFRVDMAFRAGLINAETRDEWNSEPTYVPLKGFADGRDIGFGVGKGTGKGFSVSGPEAKKARGRDSRAADLIENVIAQVEQTIIRAEKNSVAQSLIALIVSNPNDSLWQIERMQARPVRDPATGEVLQYDDGSSVLTFSRPTDRMQDIFIAKVEGKEFAIRLRGEGGVMLAAAMKNLGAANLGTFMQAMRSIGRFLSMTRTSLNPEFVIANFARDIQTAMANLSVEEGSKLARETLKNIKPAMAAIHRWEREAPGTGEFDKWYEEFRRAGAKTDYANARTIEEIAEEARNLIKEVQGGRLVRKNARKLLEVINAANAAVENSSRLAAYVAARKAGMSMKDAGSIAKNLTVNFNRRGTAGPALNGLYIFANASIQGAARFAQFVARNPKKAAARFFTPTFMLGFTLSMINSVLGGEDDDGEDRWNKVSEWERTRSMVLMVGETKLKIPLPYVYSFPFVMGSRMADVMRGDAKVSTAMASIGHDLINSFNPIGGESIVTFLSPTLLDPVVELAMNENFFGTKIRPENPWEKFPLPDSQKYWESTPEVYKWLAQGLNAATGGSQIESGLIDVSPTTFSHWADFWLGGVGSFMGRVTGLVTKPLAGEELTTNNVPFLRTVVGQVEKRQVSTDFYAFSEDASARVEQLELDAAQGLVAGASATERRAYGLTAALQANLKAAERQLTQLRKIRKLEKGSGNDDAVRAIEEQMRQTQAGFNKAYVDIMRQLGEPIR